MQLSGSEALYGFVAWLTTREEEITLGSTKDCGAIPNLIDEFCQINQLSDPREAWSELLTHPLGPADGGNGGDDCASYGVDP